VFSSARNLVAATARLNFKHPKTKTGGLAPARPGEILAQAFAFGFLVFAAWALRFRYATRRLRFSTLFFCCPIVALL
jgi:hypothetical protein